jgi:ABC-type Zn uptake system ZnuABC Zn-binding protein ZnuA
LAGAPDSSVTLLVAASGYPHDYTLTPSELETLSRAEILISAGLGLDTFLERALGVAKTGLKIIDASGGGLAVRAGGNQALVLDLATARKWYRDPEPERSDPHLFASLSGAMTMTANLAEALALLDPQGAELYRANADEVNAKYRSLLDEMKAVSAQWVPRPRVVLSHGALSHLAADLGLDVVAIIEETEEEPVSAARLAELVSRARQSAAVLADPEGQLGLARAVGAKAGRPVALIDPVASGPANPPADYFPKVFQTNLAVLHALFSGSPAPPAPPEQAGQKSE